MIDGKMDKDKYALLTSLIFETDNLCRAFTVI